MAETQIQIEVELEGTGKVEKGMKKIEGGLNNIGETGSKLADVLGSTNKQLGKGLEGVSDNVGELSTAFGSLGGAISTVGKTGAKGLMGLLGPIGLVVGAGVGLYQTFRQISGAAQRSEEAEQMMAAASSDLQSKLEMLAEKGVIPTTQELEKFSLAVIESQLAKESVEKALTKYRKEFEKITDAKRRLKEATKLEAESDKLSAYDYIQNALNKKQAQEDLDKARGKTKGIIHELIETQREEAEQIREAARQEQEFEKRSTDNLKLDIKKMANLLKEAELIKARNEAKGDQIMLADAETRQTLEMIKLEESLENATRQEIEAIVKRYTIRTVSLSKERNELDKLRLKQQEITKAEQEEAKKEQQRRREDAKKRRLMREQEQKKLIAQESQLRQIEIQLTQEGFAQQLSLENERYRATLLLSKEGSKEREIEEKRHQLALRQIVSSEQGRQADIEQQRLDRIRENNQKELELRYDLARRMIEVETQDGGFDTELERLQFESEQRLRLLELDYQREMELARSRGEEINQLEQMYALDRLAIQKETAQEQSEILNDYFDQYARGFAEASVSALLYGDSFREGIAEVLLSLSKQAGVEALMQTAKGFSMLALGDPRSAAAFKSAALFSAAAVVSGGAGKSLQGGAGGVEGGVSPMGSPTTAPPPEREQAESNAMVFNINFGGAVIYDTKKAAEQALADRVISMINTPRRGAVQLRSR